MSKPFTGVKILDFTRVLAGPYGSYQLALLGARAELADQSVAFPPTSATSILW